MSSLECETTIDSLPEEVFCMIFDLLDLVNVKSASLVCRKWHNIVFLSPYIKRFVFNIVLHLSWKPTEEELAICKMRTKEVIDIANHTQRCYRYLLLCVNRIKFVDFPSLWKSLHPNVTVNIYWLHLMLCGDIRDTFMLIVDAIPLLPKLRSFSFSKIHTIDQVTVLRSSSVQYLNVDDCNIRIDMPELESFAGPLSALSQRDDNDQPVVLAKLKYVKITHNPYDSVDQYNTIPFRFVNVESLTVWDTLEEPLFITICNTCTKLNKLYFQFTPCIEDPAAMRHLSKLSNLRQLKFDSVGKFKNCLVPWSNIFSFDFDLSELTQLEDLDLGSILFGAHRSIRLPKSITHLSVSINYKNEQNIIQNVIGSLTQLQSLRLGNFPRHVDPWTPLQKAEVAQNTLKFLNHLKQLEELVFVNVEFSESAYLDLEDLMHRLRVLRFVNCILVQNRLQELEQIFPNLKIEVCTAQNL
uniref:F-box domain-containing protein n=1 Tax=Anopheles darlingi TaxID=43151 RepID=A0A2M4CZS4_ANODA